MVLYKYFPDNIYSFKSLSFKGLWCHYPGNMNDPFECLGYSNRKLNKTHIESFRNILSESKNEKLQALIKLSDKKIKEYINKYRGELIKKFAFCSLSETFNDILMWSHYASNHTGFVLGIDFKNVNKDHHFQKVRYLDNLPDIDVVKLAEFLKGNYKHLSYLLSDISIKSKSWIDEKEWRIWRKEPCYYHYKVEDIKEIYFGVNCSPETKMIILRLTSELNKNFQYTEMEFGDNPVRLKY